MREGHPELISKEDYESWIKQSIRPEQYAEVTAANGEFPGSYMATPDGRLGIARLQFGNVVLLPQPAAGPGSNYTGQTQPLPTATLLLTCGRNTASGQMR